MLGNAIFKIARNIGCISILFAAIGIMSTPQVFAWNGGAHEDLGYAALSHAGISTGSHYKGDGQWWFSVPDTWLPGDGLSHFWFPPGGSLDKGIAPTAVDSNIGTYKSNKNLDYLRNAMHYAADEGQPYHTNILGYDPINGGKHSAYELYADNINANVQSVTGGDDQFVTPGLSVCSLGYQSLSQFSWIIWEQQNDPNWQSNSEMRSRTITILQNTERHLNSIANYAK